MNFSCHDPVDGPITAGTKVNDGADGMASYTKCQTYTTKADCWGGGPNAPNRQHGEDLGNDYGCVWRAPPPAANNAGADSSGSNFFHQNWAPPPPATGLFSNGIPPEMIAGIAGGAVFIFFVFFYILRTSKASATGD